MANGPVLVVDFGAQYAQLIARRVREANVYSELVPHSMPVDEMLAKDPQAIILSGGPASVFEPGAPRVDPKLFDAGVPVLGICYGFQAMAYALGADVDKAALGEYGKTDTTIDKTDGLLAGSPAEQDTWMSHGVAVKTAPAGFEVLAHTEGAPVAAMQDESRKLYGVQWHPEVKHTPLGQKLIETFLHQCAGLPDNWDASSIIEDQVAKIREKVGDAEVICGLSGGVDSAVAAALVHKAIGDQLTCVFVDHGLLRKGEVEQVKHDFVAATGIRLITVDAAADFLEALKGVSEPERKRKIIGEKFIRTFEKAQRQVLEEAGARGKEVKFLVQGTLYPDVVESGGGDGAANIKSHHNVGGLPKDIKFQLIEPLRTLFKDEVRAIGTELGLPDEIVWRQPFPGPGLGIRHPRRNHQGTPRPAARGRRHRPRRTLPSRPRPRHLAVPRGSARRRPFRRRPRRRAHLRLPHRPAPGQLGGRHDRRLVARALRRARHDLHPHHQRVPPDQPRGTGLHVQAAGNDRVGVSR